MLGTLELTDDGRYALRFERTYPHPPAKVWRALTETRHLREWFVQLLDYDRSRLDFADGAELTFVAKGDQVPAGRGRVTRWSPPRLLEYTWDAETLRWELEADGGDACRLVITNVLGDRDAAVAVAPGWHAGLDLLAAFLDGRAAGPPPLERLQGEYARALG